MITIRRLLVSNLKKLKKGGLINIKLRLASKPKVTSRRRMSEQKKNETKNEEQFPKYDYPLKFEIIKECKVSKARCSRLELPHAKLETPQFMPVGTQGALKGVLPHQIKELNCNLILGNTYHLGHRPVCNFRFDCYPLFFWCSIVHIIINSFHS